MWSKTETTRSLEIHQKIRMLEAWSTPFSQMLCLNSCTFSQPCTAVPAAASPCTFLVHGCQNHASSGSAPGEVRQKLGFEVAHWESRVIGCTLHILFFLEREVIDQVTDLCWFGEGAYMGKMRSLFYPFQCSFFFFFLVLCLSEVLKLVNRIQSISEKYYGPYIVVKLMFLWEIRAETSYSDFLWTLLLNRYSKLIELQGKVRCLS